MRRHAKLWIGKMLIGRPALSKMGLSLLPLLLTVSTAHDDILHAQNLPRENVHVEVALQDVCHALKSEMSTGLLRYGIAKPPLCPSRTAVIIHEPEKNQFVLRDSVKAKTDGAERIVSFSVEARYQIDALGRPVWTEIEFRSEGAH